ncbi:hypothetical protein ATC04_17600 [Arthrobacter sp. YC-RL1]|uniref:hypothetical protein n=1 Tax=Arthrobacter sp. YC-RL1 TaxID=1652545 RepID=UPI00069C99E1|nr:hypothetical protein [Arthrobacter sp. YC-RL1]ALQ32168.1 hypothetical protein ATC04_17600 [Arthrobacter sp. YC-RL1]
MPKTIHGIDLTAPGGIEALLAFHYRTFGDAVMLADGEDEEDQDESEDDDPDGSDNDDSGDSEEDEDDPDGADALGDKGKNALRVMKGRVKASKKEAREAKAELERLKNSAGKSKEDQEAEAERAQRDAAILNKANERIVRSEIKSAAAGKLQNPALAIRLLDISEFEVDEDGNVDEDEIAEAIDELLEREPYLAVQGGAGPKFDSARGKRKTTKKLTQKDLDSMSPAEIAKAYDEGKVAL